MALAALALALAAGCARSTVGARPAAPSAPPAPPPSVAGSWAWAARAPDPSGDLKLEQEEWTLAVDGAGVMGHYDRSVTVLSADGRPFRCNGEISFARRTRYEVEGRAEGGRVDLREVDYTVEPGPCESGVRVLDAYAGVVFADHLVLRWEGGERVLVRRAGTGPWPPARPPGDLPGLSPGDTPDIAGAWTWEHRGVDANGDRRVVEEEWTIERDGDDLRGGYESVVTYTAGDGRSYPCSGATEYATRARFDFTGVIEGRRVRLREIGFAVEPGPCEPGLRRLGGYSGTFDGAAIVLDWGSGKQTLRRK